jgi:hypothetical protein
MNLNALAVILAFALACVVTICYTVLSAMERPTGVLEQVMTGAVVGLIALGGAVLRSGGSDRV